MFCRFFVLKRFAPFASFLVNFFIIQEEIFVFFFSGPTQFTYLLNIYAVPKSFFFTAKPFIIFGQKVQKKGPIFITLIHRGYRDMDVIHSR